MAQTSCGCRGKLNLSASISRARKPMTRLWLMSLPPNVQWSSKETHHVNQWNDKLGRRPQGRGRHLSLPGIRDTARHPGACLLDRLARLANPPRECRTRIREETRRRRAGAKGNRPLLEFATNEKGAGCQRLRL